MTSRGRRRHPHKLTERLTILMSNDLRKVLERRADENESSMGEVARKLLEGSLLTPKEERV